MSAKKQKTKKYDMKNVLNDHIPDINKKLEEVIPRKFTNELMSSLYGPARYAYDCDTITKAISVPIYDMLDRGGKRWRPVLLLLIAEALGKSHEDVFDFVSLVEIVHNGTLLVDDIEDSSESRRGKPCSHLIFGVDVAINAGNAMYFLPLQVLKKRAGSIDPATLIAAYEVYSQEMINLHFGQGLDIVWHKGDPDTKDPSVDEYLQMCAFKTGTLARLSAKLSALVCGAGPDQVNAIGRFAESIGVAFQIQDDILNLVGEKLSQGKGGFGEDIHEGKRTIMVLHTLKNAPKAKSDRLREILASHPSDQKIIDEAIEIISSTGSIDYARLKAKEIIKAAWAEIDSRLPESDAKLKLQSFADFLIERDI